VAVHLQGGTEGDALGVAGGEVLAGVLVEGLVELKVG